MHMHIETNQILNMENLISFKKRLRASELQEHVERLLAYAESYGAKKLGGGVSATYEVNGDVMDIEMYFPIDKAIPSNDVFVFKPLLRLENCVKSNYKGHPQFVENTMKALNDFIVTNQFVPISVGFTVTVKDIIDPKDIELFEVDIYVSISPNVI